jgi:nitroimidazol reductase NimA-like FMN-containing flavoprotein (pyridoxamine 5'-phosphate oxidase superfamily)
MDDLFRQKIIALLNHHRTMRIATLRPDGWLQVTTVGYANDGFAIYFLCGPDNQKASNLARDDRVSLAIDDDPAQVMDITGLSMAARANVVADPAEAEKAMGLLMSRYPDQKGIGLPIPKPSEVRIFRLTPTVISVLDYS